MKLKNLNQLELDRFDADEPVFVNVLDYGYHYLGNHIYRGDVYDLWVIADQKKRIINVDCIYGKKPEEYLSGKWSAYNADNGSPLRIALTRALNAGYYLDFNE